MPQETHEIISGLVKLADTPEPTPVFYRIVLINYLRPVTMQNAGRLRKDEITRFEHQDIQEAIEFLFRRERIPLRRAIIDPVVNEIIANIPNQDLSLVRDVGDVLEAKSINIRDFQG